MKPFIYCLLSLAFASAAAIAAEPIETLYGAKNAVETEGEDVVVKNPAVKLNNRLYAPATPSEGEEKTAADRYCRSIGYLKQIEAVFRPGYTYHGRAPASYYYARIDENGKLRAIEKDRAKSSLVLLEVRCTNDAKKQSLEAKIKSNLDLLLGRSNGQNAGAVIESRVPPKSAPSQQAASQDNEVANNEAAF